MKTFIASNNSFFSRSITSALTLTPSIVFIFSSTLVFNSLPVFLSLIVSNRSGNDFNNATTASLSSTLGGFNLIKF